MLDLEQMLIWQFFLWKIAIFQPIKLPFDAEAAEKFLKVNYIISLDNNNVQGPLTIVICSADSVVFP